MSFRYYASKQWSLQNTKIFEEINPLFSLCDDISRTELSFIFINIELFKKASNNCSPLGIPWIVSLDLNLSFNKSHCRGSLFHGHIPHYYNKVSSSRTRSSYRTITIRVDFASHLLLVWAATWGHTQFELDWIISLIYNEFHI